MKHYSNRYEVFLQQTEIFCFCSGIHFIVYHMIGTYKQLLILLLTSRQSRTDEVTKLHWWGYFEDIFGVIGFIMSIIESGTLRWLNYDLPIFKQVWRDANIILGFECS